MNITTIPVGHLQANCYILEKDNKILIIDPGDEYEKIKSYIKNNQIIKILITHHHPDHIGALNNFDKTLILDQPKTQTYTYGPFTFQVIKTSGHTKDSVTYYFKDENTMFTGDFLFKDSIGRTDMPTGNINEMKKSLSKIKKYPDNTIIYPGHGPSTTLKYEKENNYFLKQLF